MTDQHSTSAIGVDLGGTKILAGRVSSGSDKITFRSKVSVPNVGNEDEVVNALLSCIDPLIDNSISGIGIGVPSVVDIEKGIVYDVQNIPSWKEVHLKDIVEEKYNIPVFLNNDANCFAIGEKYYGEGQNYKDVVGLIVGTGMAAGIIINDRLYNGKNCGAGEFGMIPYLDKHYEYYCSGQYFDHVHNTTGEVVHRKAKQGDKSAIAILEEFGRHLGMAVNTILYAYDPEVIILGGSVSQAFPFFKSSLLETVGKLVYQPVIDNITIVKSSQPDIAVLGAAALFFDQLLTSSL